MAASSTTTTTSFSKTPQAHDDLITESADLNAVVWLDVLADDQGGNAKVLWSLDNGDLAADLLIHDLATTEAASTDFSQHGAKIWIANGKVGYDASTLQPAFRLQLNALAAHETLTDSFTYAIRLGNGTLSWATATIVYEGTNDRPDIRVELGDSAAANFDETNAGLSATGTLTVTDVDTSDTISSSIDVALSGVVGGLHAADVADMLNVTPATGLAANSSDVHNLGWTFDSGSEAFDYLANGETLTLTYTITVNDANGGTDTQTIVVTIKGTDELTNGSVLDGYIANGLVFRDENNNSQLDTGEAFVFTDAQGNFAGLGGTGRIVLAPVLDGDGNSLTHDISTGAVFTGRLTAAAGSTVVTPLTTLIDAIAATNGGDAVAAELLVKQSLGLDPSLDLGSFDPIAIAAGGGDAAAIQQAIEVQKASVQVANIIAVIGAAVEAGGEGDPAAAAGIAAAALAAEMDGSPVDLSSPDLIGDVIDGAGVDPGAAADAIAESLANINEVIAETDASGDPLGALAAIVAGQIVAQENLAGAVGDGTVVPSDFSDAALIDQLDEAAGEVEVIVPTDPGTSTLGAPERPVADDGNRISGAEVADGVVVTVGFGATPDVVAGDSIKLLLNGLEIASVALTAQAISAGTYSFTVSAAELGADGSKVLAAQFASQGGDTGPTSLPLLVTLDTVAAAAPTDLLAPEGSILNSTEAADGTHINGRTEAGSTVSVTLTNGAQSLTRDAHVTGTDFVLDITAAEIAQLGEGNISYSAIATDAAGNISETSAAGQFLYTEYPMVDPDVRLDGTGNWAPYDDEEYGEATVVPLSNGGFAVQWIADTTGDGDGDTFAIQGFDAAGHKVGDPVLLQGLAGNLTADRDGGSETNAVDLTSLDGGGYALAYKLDMEETNRFFGATNTNPNSTTMAVGVVGRPVEIDIQSAPQGATFALTGTKNGLPVIVALTVVDGEIAISPEQLEQFDFPDRTVLQIGNVPLNASVNLSISGLQARAYGADIPLHLEPLSFAVPASGPVFLSSPNGRVELFDLDTFTPTGPNATYVMIINPAKPINIAGINGVFQNPFGIIVTGNVPANGVIPVPQALLNLIGVNDASIVLQVNGLAPNTPLTANLSVRTGIEQDDGVFVQTFGADGVALGDAVRVDGPGNYAPHDDGEDAATVVPLANGGFAVQWIADTTGDDDGDTVAIQRYDASGNKVGSVALLQGLPEILTEDNDGASHPVDYDVAVLDGGGYALIYKLEMEDGGFFVPVQTSNAFISIAGRPVEFDVGNVAGSVSFVLFGTGPGGTKSISLVPHDGEIVVTEAMLAQFSVQDRFTLQVIGASGAQPVNVNVSTLQTRVYEEDSQLNPSVRSAIVGANGAGNLSDPTGRVESFHIDSLTAAGPLSYGFFILPALGPNSLNLSGLTLPPNVFIQMQPNGIFVGGTGLVPNASGVISVPQAILDRLDNNDAIISLNVQGLQANSTLTATASVRSPTMQTEGVFVQTFDANGVALAAPQLLDQHAPYDDEDGMTSIIPLPGGGFAAQWIDDTTGDGDGDTFAIQRYDALGNKVGAVVLLHDLPDALTADLENGSEVLSADLTALENGGYALTYKMEQYVPDRQVNATMGQNQTSLSITIAGRPMEIDITTAPAAATYALSGQINGVTTNVSLTAVNGEIDISREFLAQFDFQDRLSLVVGNVVQGDHVDLHIGAAQTRLYDEGSALESIAKSVLANSGGFSALGTAVGRSEVFDFDTFTPAAPGSAIFTMFITPGVPINLAGIGGAVATPNGTFQVNGLTPDANGIIAVPQAILDALEGNDANIFIAVRGLAGSSAVTGTVLVREAIQQPEGIYIATFDANGDLVSNDLSFQGTAGDDVFRFDEFASGANQIVGFLQGDDRIDLSGIDANQNSAGNGAFAFIGAQAFHAAAGELRTEVISGTTVVSGDVDGDGVADFQIELVGSHTLLGQDFIL